MGHLEFKGVPIDGTKETFTEKLLQNEFELVEQKYIIGKFAGLNCLVTPFTTALSKTVWKVNIIDLQKFSQWIHLKAHYEKYVNMFRLKYGEPSSEFHFFKTPYNEGGGEEMIALSNEMCVYQTFFDVENGTILIALIGSGQVLFSYDDKSNAELMTKENDSMILADI